MASPSRPPKTKLVRRRFMGIDDAAETSHFMHDLADHLANCLKLTANGHSGYLTPFESLSL